ncbi:MAG TPA: serine/threonine protein kinase [Cyanobacteria bacterium UBA9226]|nr:serine/threonine protein kinase [Cyanobacteria bacterium UBA9226]
MTYCLNPNCSNPQNPSGTNFCVTCGTALLLKQRYRALKPLGQGGFGKTFLATDEDKPSHPPCVIKQFLPQAQGTSTLQKAAELFEREAIRLDELGKHPQIPDLLAYFSQDGQQYLVQEFIEGQDLAKELANQGSFKEGQVESLLHNLLPVLQFVHEHQVIHRDIKPENIIRRKKDNQLFIVDFGAAKAVTGAGSCQTGTVIGSMGFVAPEQTMGKALFASDIYSLGVTSIHLLTGLHPFDLFDPTQGVWVWRKILKKPISNDLAAILDKMLQSAVNLRYQSATEILKDLQPKVSPNSLKQPKLMTPVNPQISPKPAQQQKPAPPTPSPRKPQPTLPSYGGRIDEELAALKSEILGIPTPKNQMPQPGSQKPNLSPPTKPKSAIDKDIDRELEELKSQFGGGNY